MSQNSSQRQTGAHVSLSLRPCSLCLYSFWKKIDLSRWSGVAIGVVHIIYQYLHPVLVPGVHPRA